MWHKNIQQLKLSDLVINSENIRHEPYATSEEAMKWFLDNKPNEVRKLAEDIV